MKTALLLVQAATVGIFIASGALQFAVGDKNLGRINLVFALANYFIFFGGRG